jgi:hypothetical protein
LEDRYGTLSGLWRSPSERSWTTQRRQWHFFGPTTGLLWKRSLADHVEKSEAGDSSRSRVATTDRDKNPAERLHLKVANSRCRPKGVGGTFSIE